MQRLRVMLGAVVLLNCTGSESPTGPPQPAAVASVSVSVPRTTLRVGESVQAVATAADANGGVITGRSITWTSSNNSIVTVTGGVITAVGLGSADVSATIEGKVGTVALSITLVPVASVTIIPASDSVIVGHAIALTVLVKDSAGNTLSGRALTWQSSDSTKVTVTATGLIRGVSAGSAVITASAEGKNGSATVKVLPVVVNTPVASVVVTLPRTALRVGESIQAVAIPADSLGGILSGRLIFWTSSDPAVVSVSTGGIVEALSPGVASVRAEVDGKAGTVVVQISLVPVSSVTLSPTSESVSAGASVTLVAILKDSAGRILTGRLIAWVSTSPAVATVSEAGVVTGLLVGTAEVIATSEGKEGRATLTVNTLSTAVASVVAGPSNVEMSGGATKQLTATLRDANGNVLGGRNVTWSSSNPDRATVSQSGLVTAAPVTAPVVITATSEGQSGNSSIGITTFVMMRTGNGFTCALTADGTAYCWGRNSYGQLGDGTTTTRSLPTKVNTDLKFVLLATGGGFTGAGRACGVVASGLAYCWGRDDMGGPNQLVPTPAPGGFRFVSIAVGAGTTCGTTSERELYCWGSIWYSRYAGILEGSISYTAITGPILIAQGIVAGVGGVDNDFCGVDESDIAYCGRIAVEAGGLSKQSPVSTSLRFTTIRVGDRHKCGLVASGQAYCWGRNDVGQLGDGTTINRSEPTAVSGGVLFQTIAAGGNWLPDENGNPTIAGGFTCGLNTGGKAYCWGSNAAGRLGIGSAAAAAVSPQPVAGDITFTGIRVGAYHGCGLAVSGAAYCWGEGIAVGDGTSISKSAPALVFGN